MSKIGTVEYSNNTVTMSGEEMVVGQPVKLGLGKLELQKNERGKLQIARFSNSGQFQYAVKLNRDGQYRFGPRFGHYVKPSRKERDPIKRILRDMNIPVSNLEQITEATLEIGERWYDNSHCPNGRSTNKWIHDGRETSVNSEMLEQPHGYFGGGGCETSVIEGASYAICVDSGRHMNGSSWTRPGQIVVWPNCEPKALAGALASIIYGNGADADYIEALTNLEMARRWIAQRYEYIPEEAAFSYGQDLPEVLHFQEKGGYKKFSVKLDEEGCYIEDPVRDLYHKFGIDVLKDLYEDEKAKFKRLFENVVAAETFITGRFNLRRTPVVGHFEWHRDQSLMVQVAEKGSARWQGPIFGGSWDYPKIVSVLLQKHGDKLKRRLFNQAPPSKDW